MKLSSVIGTLLALAIVGALGWAIADRLREAGATRRSIERGPVPVEVVAVEVGPIERARTFSGTLESPTEFVVAPKVGGRVVRLAVDLADDVMRGQAVAWLDSDEWKQAVAQAEAELAVARANLVEAENALEIASRALDRTTTLRERGISSESQLDTARADHLAKQASVDVAKAGVTRAEAAVETAKIRLGYATVTADWDEGDDTRVVAERFADEGDTVAANTPLLSIVELDPLEAVIYATERDYGMLHVGQSATLRTDAWPGENFAGEIARIAPVFRRASRQARIELAIENPQRRLKPGMFVRARVVLERATDATIVPVAALVTRDGRDVVFVVAPGTASEDGSAGTVSMRPVTVAIRDGERAQVVGERIEGRVVVLGQQLLDDGSRISIPDVTDSDVTRTDIEPSAE